MVSNEFLSFSFTLPIHRPQAGRIKSHFTVENWIKMVSAMSGMSSESIVSDESLPFLFLFGL